jgi:hypothetical protein
LEFVSYLANQIDPTLTKGVTAVNVDENRWVALLKDLKQKQLGTDVPDIPTTIIVEKNNKVWAIATAPVSDRDAGLHAASILKMAIDPDLIVFISDGYIKDADISERDLEKPRLADEFKKHIKGVREVLLCAMINRDKEVSMVSLPYSYGSGSVLIWEEQIVMQGGEGYLVHSLIRIMELPLMIDRPEVQQAAKELELELDRERQIYHGGRGAIQALRFKGFIVTDFFSLPEHRQRDEELMKRNS